MPPDDGGTFGCYLLFFLFSHCWFAMPQLVLQADWQDVWHSPQPPFLALSQRFFVSRVLMGFITLSSGFPYFRSDACAARYKRSEAQLYCITIQSACQYSFCGSRGFLRASIPSAPRAERRRARGRRSPAADCRAHSPKAARHTKGSQANALSSPRFPKSFAVQGGCRRTENRLQKARINVKIAFPHTGDPRLGCRRAQSADAIHPAASQPKRPPIRIAKTRGFRPHSPNRYTIFSTTTRTMISA